MACRVTPINTSYAGLLAAAMLLACATEALELDPPVIKEVMIIGTKEANLKLSGSGVRIDADELKKHAYSDLNQLVSAVPGVYVREEDGFGLRPNIGIRGATSDRSQKITLMEDGVLIGPAPYSAPAAYYITNASRVFALEVLKGPSAIKSGPHTVGGAINLVTRPVPTDNTAEIDLTAGSDGYKKFAGAAAYVHGDVGILVEGLQYSSDGFKRLDDGGDTGFERNDINLKVRWKPQTKLQQTLTLKLGFADEDADETYLGLADSDFAIDPLRRYPASRLDRFQSEHRQIHVRHSMTLENGLDVNTKLYLNEFDRSWNKFSGFMKGPKAQKVLGDPGDYLGAYETLAGIRDSTVGDFTDLTLDITDNYREYRSQGVQFDLSHRASFWGLDHQIDVGLRYHEDQVRRRHQQRSYLMRSAQLVSDGIERPYKTNNFAHTDAVAVSVSNQISWLDWTINVGVRYEDISGSVDNFLEGTSIASDQSITAPGFGAHLQVTETIGVLAGVYVGFSPAGPGKSGADAEESTNFEYGVRYSTPTLSGEVIAFHSDYDNLLGRCRASDSDCDIGQEFSGGVVEVSGIEFLGEVEFAISDAWLLTSKLNYTYSDSEFEESFFSQFSQWGLVDKGDELPYIPKHVGRWQVALEGDRWSVDLALKYQHEMREEPGSGDIGSGLHTDSLTVLDIAVSRVVNDDLELKLLLRNAADKTAIVSHRPYGARPNQPRTLLAQVKYRF